MGSVAPLRMTSYALSRLASAAAILLAAAAARADEGSFDLLLVGQRNLTVISVGDATISAGGAAGVATIVRSSGAPFAADANASVQCVNHSRKAPAGFELEADCVALFSAEDTIDFHFTRRTGDLTAGTSGGGAETLTDGTGRFAGVKGDCTYQVDNLANHWNVTRSKCSWHR